MRQKTMNRGKAMAIWLVFFLFVAPVIVADTGMGAWQAAFADDDDDDGGDSDDDDDDDRPSSSADRDRGREPSANATRNPASRRSAPARRAAPVIRPDFAPEIVVSDLSSTDLATLISTGFELIERRTITTLALTLDRLAAPRGVTLEDARNRVRALPSGVDADFNHYYRSNQTNEGATAPQQAPCTHENCAAWQMIDWPQKQIDAGACPVTAPIGVIDTGINPDHDILDGAKIDILQRPSLAAPSGAVHGTAVVSLLLGNPASRVPGLLPDGQVIAVDIFSKVAGDKRADLVALVEGLDLLAAQQVRLYNVSLSGPPNTVLARMMDRLTDAAGLDAVIIAAAGNGGPSAAPAWPGAHPDVLAVTAVDARGRAFGQAQRGDHLGLAAPGVNLLAATSISGARPKSGTSFAVPFVTAAAALLMSGPQAMAGDAVRAHLLAAAIDLGTPGQDAVFGHGLLSAQSICPTGME